MEYWGVEKKDINPLAITPTLQQINIYSGCQKNVPVFKRFFLQPYILLCRTSEFRNIIMENGIKYLKTFCLRLTFRK